jgi:threonine aldolase
MAMLEKNFRSDNVAPVAPEIMAALVETNRGTDASYGADHTTERARQAFAALFETELWMQPAATGTAANALCLSVIAPPFGAIYCSATAHISDSECGAGEFFTGGAKIVQLPAKHGKIDPAALEQALATAGKGQQHKVQPAALSITEANERGVVYSVNEVRKLAAIAKAHGLKVHMDGTRFANAIAALGCSPADLTWRAGVDILSFGATKNGAMGAEAVIVFRRELAAELGFRARRAGQVFSKMRYVSTQLEAMLRDGLWLRLAGQANRMGARLAAGLAGVPGVTLLDPAEINEIFCIMPQGLIESLKEDGFGLADRGGGQVRFVTAFTMQPADIDFLIAAAQAHAKRLGLKPQPALVKA